MENKNTALVKSNTALTRVSNQLAITNRLLEVADPFLIPYRKGDKWGFCDKNKKVIISCLYDSVKPFSDGLAAVEICERWGFVNKFGHIIIPFKYEDVGLFSEQLAAVKYDEKWGFINCEGSIQIDIVYRSAGSFSEGVAWVIPYTESEASECFELLDKNGDIIFVEFSSFVSNCREGSALVGDYNKYDPEDSFKYRFIFKDGDNWVKPLLEKLENGNNFSEGLAAIQKHEKYGFVNTEGNVIIAYTYDFAGSFRNGFAPVMRDETWWYINKKEEKTFSSKFDECYDFSENLARVKLENKYGYINNKGELIIPCIYDLSGDFVGGIALVERNRKRFCIDLRGSEYFEGN